ncbi:MAG: ParB/RepB/Spo0J family partition protein [Acidobacteria bacterium]|nr:ParB/RepB/Spo0J family partition protein [Acidobacteriota bacterium]
MSKKALGRGLSALFNPTSPLENDLLELNIDQIEPHHSQPRRLFNEEKLEELAQSIRANGLIQPIVVRRLGESFQIIAGERRWRAAQRAGLLRIPCVIKDVQDQEVLALSLIENIQREELNPIEEATAYKNLLEQLNVTQEEIARQVGKDRSSITNALRLLKLPLEVQTMVEEGALAMGHARALLALEAAEKQIALAKRVVHESLSVRETERLVRALQEPKAEAKPKPAPDPQIAAERANIHAAETRLSKKLSTPVKIKFTPNGGAIEIKFTSMEDLTRVYDLLEESAKQSTAR